MFEPLYIRLSSRKALWMITGPVLFFVLSLRHAGGMEKHWIAQSLFWAFFSLMYGFKSWKLRGRVLTIDMNGIRDPRVSAGIIAWDQIAEITCHQGARLFLTLRDPELLGSDDRFLNIWNRPISCLGKGRGITLDLRFVEWDSTHLSTVIHDRWSLLQIPGVA